MKKFRYLLLLLAASVVWGCQKFEVGLNDNSTSTSSTIVERTEDGRYKVTAQFKGESMTSVVTRASEKEDAIYDGWCLVFGEDPDNVDKGEYTDDSPLIQIEKVSISADGFTMVFDEYPHTAFMRIVVNLTDRENNNFSSLQNGSSSDGYKSWRAYIKAHPDAGLNLDTPPTKQQVEDFKIATFGEYRHQSVGLDGIYNIAYDTKSNLVNGTFLDYTKPDGTPVYVTSSMQYTTEGGSAGTSSVTGLPETYNKNQPNPTSSVITTNDTGFPMASYGFELAKITEESLKEAFGKIIYMIRTCSKVQVDVEDSNFKMDEVYLIGAAQEARIRSTTLSEVTTDADGNTTTNTTNFDIPADLGGAIDYAPLTVTNGKTSDPIYFYPNSGGDYEFNNGVVDQDVNPQYIIIKGQSTYYDTPGYYKVALKAQYPLSNDSDASNMGDENKWSPLTYDILRNTSFTVKLLSVDKPGYKTYEDAADPNSPANNISYSLDIETSNNHYEVLVSKGTYYTELESSRVYVKGYMDEGVDGCYVDFIMNPTEGNTVPAVYVQSNDHDGNFDQNEDVVIRHCLVMREGDAGYATSDWTNATKVGLETNTTNDGLGGMLVHIAANDDTEAKKATKVRVYFDVNDSGRLRLRIGDILKFIPIVYDPAPISMYGTKGQGSIDNGVVVTDTHGTSWSDFSYSEMVSEAIGEYADQHYDEFDDFKLEENGTVTHTTHGVYDYKPELRARIFPKEAGDGIAVLYLRQASDFAIDGFVAEGDGDASTTNVINYSPQGKVLNAEDLKALAGLNVTIEKNNISGTFDNSEKVTIKTASVDDLTISQNSTNTTGTSQPNYIESNYSSDGTSVSFYTKSFSYDIDASGDYDNNIMRKPSTTTTEITLTNAAGDTKKYNIYQTHNPPIYLVAKEGSTKSFTVRTNANNKDNTCIFAVGIYNWDGNTSANVKWTSKFDNTYGAMDNCIYSCILNTNYIDNYNYSSNASGNSYTGYSTSNTSATFNELDELAGRLQLGTPSDAQFPDAAFIIMRDGSKLSNDGGWVANKNYSNQTITITDQYGEVYKVTKQYYVSW